jgi:hypothetical protein
MSVEDSYPEIMSPMRFDYMSMQHPTNQNAYNHYYNAQVKQADTPSQTKIIRLA